MAYYQAGGYYNNQAPGGYPYPQPGYPQPPGPGYSPYNVNNYGYPMQPQPHPQMQQQMQAGYNCGPCPQPMNMPQSIMTNQMMADSYAFNMHALNMNVARQMGLLEGMPAQTQVNPEEKEEDRRKREEEMAMEIEAKIVEKLESDEALFEEMRQRYIDTLLDHLVKYGTLEPTEGSIKPFENYPGDDPVVIFYKEYDGEDLTGKPWNAEADVCYLREAMKGAGTDEDAIIHVVASRCNGQRQTLKQKFKTNFGRDIIEDLKSELSGDFKECIMALFVKPAYYDAWCIKHAVKGLGTDERSLIEILMTRTNAQIKEIRECYRDVNYPTDKVAEILEKDIKDDTSGDFRKLLVSACQGDRYEIGREQLECAVESVLTHDGKPMGQFKINFDTLVEIDKAKRDAAKLVSSGEGRLGTDEEQFNRIFSTRELYQMRRTYTEYVKLTQRDILNSIERETSGDFEKGLYACIMNVKCRPMYFAERLVQAMKGLGTNESDLIRIIVSRSEMDMVQIKQCFLELTKQTLWNWIKQDCGGDFKKILQQLVSKD